MLLEQAEMQGKHETEFKDARQRTDAVTRDLADKLNESQKSLLSLQDAKRQLDSDIKDLKQ